MKYKCPLCEFETDIKEYFLFHISSEDECDGECPCGEC